MKCQNLFSAESLTEHSNVTKPGKQELKSTHLYRIYFYNMVVGRVTADCT